MAYKCGGGGAGGRVVSGRGQFFYLYQNKDIEAIIGVLGLE